jgi:chromosome segregation ATPase
MPRKQSHHAKVAAHHAKVAELQEAADAEQVRLREAETALAAAKTKLERAEDAITVAYADGDDAAATRERKNLDATLRSMRDLELRKAAAHVRVERAVHDRDQYERQHARDLLVEIEPEAVALANDCNKWEAEGPALRSRWVDIVNRTNRLVALADGAARYDCPSDQFPFAAAIEEMRAKTDTVMPYVPHWSGTRFRQDENQRRRSLKEARKERVA